MSGIEEYLTNEFNARKTRNTYRAVLKKYFEIIGADPETYFNEGRTQDDYLKDLKTYINTFLVGRPAKTCTSYISGIKGFHKYNKVLLDEEELKTIRKRHKNMKSNRALTKDRPPSITELQRILSHGTVMDKAFFSILFSSGMRIGELAKMPKNQGKEIYIYFDENPVRIDIPETITKNGERRTTFMSNEAKKFLQEWLRVRDDYINNVAFRSQNLPNKIKERITPKDPRLFPYNTVTMWRRWGNMCEKAELTERDIRTKRAIIHPHGLRKGFRTIMGTKIGIDFTEEMMGHAGYLAESYVRHTDEELASAYKLGMNAVTIFEREIPQDMREWQQRDAEKDKKIAELESRMQRMMEDMQHLLIENDKKNRDE
ncbi:hypothetical protein AYK25_04310 [Thermoplasmatales archaeon SM1-50]|nr:MAG: hypothetical protein AYK25_04310 [Thermoplasmatales archaeon SM1-50]